MAEHVLRKRRHLDETTEMETRTTSSPNAETATINSLMLELQRLHAEREQDRREFVELQRQMATSGELHQMSHSRNTSVSDIKIKPDT